MNDLKAPALTHTPERVQVYIPHGATFDIKKMERITAQVLGRLGCEGCHSGHRLDFIALRDFVVNPANLEVKEIIGPQQFSF